MNSPFHRFADARSLVIDHLKAEHNARNIGIAYIYFDYKNQGKQVTEYCLRSILKQLLLFLDIMPAEVEKLYDNCSASSTSPDADTLTSLLALSVLRLSRVFLVLDGLDECNQEGVLPRLIRQLRTLDVKTICTSRPHLLNLPDQLGATSSLEISARSEDVEKYLTARLEEEWLFDKNLKANIIESISKQVQGK